MELRYGVGLLTVVGSVFLALGLATGTALSAREGTATGGASVAEALPAPDPSGPLRIVLAGDSVMGGLVPAMEAALDDGESAEVEFLLTPTILREESIRFAWEQQLEAFHPDVVVMLVGAWELGEVQREQPGSGDWRRRYDEEILDPWMATLEGHDVEVVWLGAPVTSNPEVNLLFIGLNEAYRGLESRWSFVRYVDTNRALGAPDGGYTEIADGPAGMPVRLRQVDGLHLCPDGAVRVVELVTETVGEFAPVTTVAGWEAGGWREDPEYPPDACPPA